MELVGVVWWYRCGWRRIDGGSGSDGERGAVVAIGGWGSGSDGERGAVVAMVLVIGAVVAMGDRSAAVVIEVAVAAVVLRVVEVGRGVASDVHQSGNPWTHWLTAAFSPPQKNHQRNHLVFFSATA